MLDRVYYFLRFLFKIFAIIVLMLFGITLLISNIYSGKFSLTLLVVGLACVSVSVWLAREFLRKS